MSSATKSASKAVLVPTNLEVEDLVMDTRGHKDPRFYCLPPYRGDRSRSVRPRRGGGYPLHLVFQGRRVGIFDHWPEAQQSLSGYPASGNQGFDTEEECIDAWQAMCVLGVHPHPVDPAFVEPPAPTASTFVNVSPRKSSHRSVSSSPIKREREASVKREAAAEDQAQVLADLKRYCSPILPPTPSPRKRADRAQAADDYVNFAIRGGGIISSSAERSEQRYRELQRAGDQPDMLVTRSFAQASLFALEENDDEKHEN